MFFVIQIRKSIYPKTPCEVVISRKQLNSQSQQQNSLNKGVKYTAWKVSVFGVFLVGIKSECGKTRKRKAPNTFTFHAVICSKLKIKPSKLRSGVLTANLKQLPHVFLVSSFLILNKQMSPVAYELIYFSMKAFFKKLVNSKTVKILLYKFWQGHLILDTIPF